MAYLVDRTDTVSVGRSGPKGERLMIHVEHLNKDYGPTRALNDVSFDVARGEVVGLLGPNGAGKTTVMRILAGYMPPTKGRASIARFDVFEDSLAAHRHRGSISSARDHPSCICGSSASRRPSPSKAPIIPMTSNQELRRMAETTPTETPTSMPMISAPKIISTVAERQ